MDREVRRRDRNRIGCWALIGMLLSALPGAGCGRQEPPPKRLLDAGNGRVVTGDEILPGVHQHSLLGKDGERLRYTLVIPDEYSAAADPLPLIVALHFGGEVTPYFGEGVLNLLVGPAFRPLPAILVAPDSVAGPWTNEENEAAVMMILDHIIQAYNVDEERIVLTGYSLGGHGTWYIAGRNQDRFSAAIPIAGTPDESIDTWSIPVYAIHSPTDRVVPIEPTREYVQSMREKGFDIRLMETRSLPHEATDAFALPLRNAITWLKRVWKTSPTDEVRQ